MYLKRLELHGFKSFADKTVLEFQPGVTLVVGPNGSGKSNIADAIRWVLGEQSAKSLRGGKMEDVIFAGSDKRKSLGMAEVSLTIDNSTGSFPLDFNEITVTRRLFRSGDSDYLINKVPCRLKDIHELFMDTGVGREGFSMIGQGRVEEILMARPEERRAILEDAAGIIKYRYRKKEATKKLDETRQHLLRIEDLLLELRSQEEPLRFQSEEAKAYQILKKELDELEMGMISGEIQIAHEKLEKLQEELSQLQQELIQRKTGIINTQSQEEGVRLELDKQGDQLAEFQEKIYQQSIKIEKLEGEKRSHQQRSQSLEEQANALEKEKESLQKEWIDLSKQWQGRQEEGANLAQSLNLTRQTLESEELLQASVEEEVKINRLSLTTSEDNHFDLLKQDTMLQNESVKHNQDLLAMNRQQERLEENKKQTKEAVTEAINKKEALEAQQTSIMQRIKEQNLAYVDKEAIKQQAKNALEQQQKSNRELAGKRSQAISKFKLLEEMEKEGQGYSQGVKEILHKKGKDWGQGILGTVAQNLRVDKDYELAVEIALGGAAQNVITDTDKTAQEAMRWLKSYDKGRVTFLPLSTLRSRDIAKEGIPKGKGVLGRIVDLVDFEDRLLPVMEFNLGRVWVIDQLNNAVARAKENGFRYKLVTLDGQVVNAGGSLTGGSVRLSGNGFISRRRQLEELDREIRKLSEQIVNGENVEANFLMDLEQSKEALNQINQLLQQRKIDQANIVSNLGYINETIERLNSELEAMNWQEDDSAEEEARLTGALADIAAKKEKLNEFIQESNIKINQLKHDIELMEFQRTSRQNVLTELRIEVAANEERLNAFDKEGAFLKNRIDHMKGMIHSQTENAHMCRKQAKDYLKSIELSHNEIQRLLAEIELQKKAKADLQIKRTSLQNELITLDVHQKEIATEIEKREDRLRKLEIQEGRYLASLEEWSQRLQEQFGLSWEEIIGKIEPVQERKKAQQRIKVLREQIGNMQQVNLGAVEEYDRLIERLKFLNEQTADLIQAKADLEQVIQSMDSIVAKKFKETYEQINLCFNQVFQRLFDGGHANLFLTNPDNLLETGIDIMAQPPGKKTQHLSLLSGGEKALTAISLLLAMLQVRPSPFSILDEIESNLDEANVNRFAALIKEYCIDGGQFIIITHRRGTMEIGDVIYGVAAEETSGVSKILSVRLDR